jgi:hypothetical protein
MRFKSETSLWRKQGWERRTVVVVLGADNGLCARLAHAVHHVHVARQLALPLSTS